jgi:hypothetical protein
MPEVVMFSPREPGERENEGCLEEGLESWLKREESIRETWRRLDGLGVSLQLWFGEVNVFSQAGQQCCFEIRVQHDGIF